MGTLFGHLTAAPGICGGKPCIAGTRMRASDVLDLLASGASRDEVLADYPYLKDDDITAVLAFASGQLVVRHA